MEEVAGAGEDHDGQLLRARPGEHVGKMDDVGGLHQLEELM